MNKLLIVLLLPLLFIVPSCDSNDAIYCPGGSYGCDGVCGSDTVIDDCEICGGLNASMDCSGVCEGADLSCVDGCGILNGLNPFIPYDDCNFICDYTIDETCGYWLSQGYSCTELIDLGHDCSSCESEGFCANPDFLGMEGLCGVTGDDVDCAGVCFGTSLIDDCGVCSLLENFNSSQDDCGVCSGGNADRDCAGVCFGDAWESDCGCVSGPNFGDDCDDCADTPNGDAVVDCAGECGGSATIDECGICEGDGSSCDGSQCLDCANLLGSWTGVTEDYYFGENCDPYTDFIGQDASGRSFNFMNDCSYDFIYDYDDEYSDGTGSYDCAEDSSVQLCDDNGCINITYETVECSESDFCIEAHWTQTEFSCTYCVDLILAKDCESGIYDCAGVCDGNALEDCTGECGGSSTVDECGTCDANSENDCIEDCAGDWGGLAVIDACGICDADAGNDCTFDILYNSTVDFEGFTFDLDGVLSASGGAAESEGLLITAGNPTVLAFSLTGTPISAGSGVLITIVLEPGSFNHCIEDISVLDADGNELDTSSSECLNIIIAP